MLNNRYQLKRRLGSGGMAMVFEARDLMLERDVAIKVLREDFSLDPAFRERFRQEAKAAANLSHSNIVTVHDFGFDNDRLFIVMEYVVGSDLKDMIVQRGRFSADEALALMVQACAGVGYAHRAGLIHCDIKPHNLLVSPDRRIKVTDFGISRALESIDSDEQLQIVWGSPQYLSPEQAAGGAPSPASDVYSLGVVMYEMLAGRLPFVSDDPQTLIRMHKDDPPPPLSEHVSNIPPVLEQIVMKVLSKEPASRYRTADQLGRVLMTFTQAKRSGKIAQAGVPRSAPQTDALPPEKASDAPTMVVTETASPTEEVDWISVGLAFLAIALVAGLIPFWVWVYVAFQ